MHYRVIILADRTGAELSPLDRDTCPALLEVGGRRVIEYTLEDLCESGVLEATIVSSHVEGLRAQLGNGGRWGIRLSYLLTRPEQSPADCIRRVSGRGPLLLIRGDIVRGRCVREFLKMTEVKTYRTVAGVSERMDAGICLINGVWTHGCTWPSFELGVNVVELGDIGLFRLDSLRDFHAACMAAAQGEIRGVNFAGRATSDGRICGRLSESDGARIDGGRLHVGDEAKVSRDVEITGTVSIGSGAFVDQDARLENTVVMPGSYVGKQVELKNAIVAGRSLIRVDIGASTDILDDFLLSPLQSRRRGSRLGRVVDQVIGLALLALSIPLWPLALIASGAEGAPLLRGARSFVSNHRTDAIPEQFKVREWSTSIPLLRYLPWLIPVVGGHLRLVGVRAAPAGSPPGDEVSEEAGLIGPALLDVGPDATDEEIDMGETLFARGHGRLNRLRYLARSLGTLLSGKAWLPAR